jgi:hypothetical protein
MEPFMTMRYLIVRYIPDLARQEPKNIGVLLASSRGVMAKFLGERDAKLDLRSVRSLVSHTGTYKQWIDYWRHVISQDADPDTKLNQVLESSRGNFVVSEGGVVYLPPDIASDPHKTLNHLFFLLVSEFPAQQEEEAELSLGARCDEIIRKFELRRNPHFKETPVVELLIGTDVRQHIMPSYAWVNGTETYFQKVSIVQAKPEACQKNVNNAAWIFEKLKEGDERRITKALVKVTEQSAPEEVSRALIDPAEYLAVLKRLSDVVDVDDEEHVERVFAPLMANA